LHTLCLIVFTGVHKDRVEMKRIILKNIEALDTKYPCKGCVFRSGDYECNLNFIIDTQLCLRPNGKYYIWVVDRIEDKE